MGCAKSLPIDKNTQDKVVDQGKKQAAKAAGVSATAKPEEVAIAVGSKAADAAGISIPGLSSDSKTADRKKVVVIGSTGYIGSATIKALSARGDADVVAVARNPESDKCAAFSSLPNVTVVAGDMSDASTLTSALAGADAAFVVTPGHIDRAKLAAAAFDACKAAGVPFVGVVSVTVAGNESTIFGRQFKELEAHVTGSGQTYALVRLPMFLDNQWAQAGAISGNGQFYGPCAPDKPLVTVTVDDVGEASAAILVSPAGHENKTYDFISGSGYTYTELAAAFSAALGKEVSYVQVPYATAKESFMGLGMPEWQVDGVMELFHAVDDGTFPSVTSADLDQVLGHESTSIAAWTEAVKGGFGASSE